MKIPPFLRKLKLIIQTISPNIAGWNEDGDVFEVVDPKAFGVELSRHFKGTEQTFIRQLHFYGFTKFDCTRNLRKFDKPLPQAKQGAWSFSHPLLLQSSPELIDNIQRQAEKKTSIIGQSDSGDEFDEGADQSTSTALSLQNEVSKLKQLNKELNNSVQILNKKISTLTTFLEEEGFNPEEVLSSNPNSSKKRTRIPESRVAEIPLKSTSNDVKSFDDNNDIMRLEYDTINEAPQSPELKRAKFEFSELQSPLDFKRQTSIEYFMASSLNAMNNDADDIDFITTFNDEADKESFNNDNINADFQIKDDIENNDLIRMSSLSIEPIRVDQEYDSIKQEPKNEKESQNLFVIDPDAIAKIVMHLREALNAAIPNKDGSLSPKSPNSNNIPSLSYLSPRKRTTRRTSNIKNSDQHSDIMQLKAHNQDRNAPLQKFENSISTLLPKLIALPQIRDALLRQGNCSKVESGSSNWNSSLQSILTVV